MLYLLCHCVDQLGKTALMLAFESTQRDCISILIANGADTNMACEVGDCIYIGSMFVLSSAAPHFVTTIDRMEKQS